MIKQDLKLTYRRYNYDIFGCEVNDVFHSSITAEFPNRKSLDSMKDYQVLEHLNLDPEFYEIDNNVDSYPEVIYILNRQTGLPYCEYRLEK